MNAYETPLVELLKTVPKDAMFVEEEEFRSTYHPVGRLCHEAADRIAELEKQVIGDDYVFVCKRCGDELGIKFEEQEK